MRRRDHKPATGGRGSQFFELVSLPGGSSGAAATCAERPAFDCPCGTGLTRRRGVETARSAVGSRLRDDRQRHGNRMPWRRWI